MGIRDKFKYLNVIGIILLFYIISQIGVTNILEAFHNIDLFYLFISILLIFPIILMKGLKLLIVTKTHSVDFSLKDSCVIYLIGQYLGFITPARMGEVIKVFYFKLKTNNLGKSLSVVIVDRFLDLLAVLLFSLFGAFYLTSFFTNELFSQLLILLMILTASVLLFLKKKFLSKLLKPIYLFLIPARFKQYVLNRFNEFHGELIVFSKNYSKVFFLILFSLISWFVAIVQGYFLVLALHMQIDFLYFISISPLVVLVTLLPITISGIGTREVSFLFFFSLIGIAPEKTLAFSILAMIITYWSYALIGAILWFKEPLEFNKSSLTEEFTD